MVSLKLNLLHFVWEVIKFSEICFIYLDVCIDIKTFVRHSKFHTDIQSFFQEVFCQNSGEFSKIREYKINDDPSFNFLSHSLSSECGPFHIDFTGDLDFINRSKFLCCWYSRWRYRLEEGCIRRSVKCMCLISRNAWVQKANWMSVFSRVSYPHFQLSLFLPRVYTLFLIRMLLLDLLPSKLILVLRFEIFQWFTLKTKACFARSKSMDLNDFLIHSSALNIRLSCNLITQSPEDRFHEYIN